MAQSTLAKNLIQPHSLFIIVFVAVFTLYTLTLAPGVVGGDAGEHQFAVPLLGIPHTTGYPLYVLTGKLWIMLIPIGSMAWRMNLFSALGGALAAATTALVVYHLSILDLRFWIYDFESLPNPKSTWPGAVVAGIALSFGLTLWQWSIIAGVRSFNVFFFALLTLEAIIWAEQLAMNNEQLTNSTSQNSKPKIHNSERTLRLLAFTVGLSLAHHRTTIFYLPSLVFWIWWHDRRLIRQPKRMLTLALLTLAPLSLYLFIYLRGVSNPPYTHEPIYNLQSFWFLVGSGDSSGLFFAIDPAYLPSRLSFIWADILRQISWPGVILAIIGGLTLLRRATIYFIFQGLLVLLLLLFVLDFEVVNLNQAPTWYLMPAYFIFAVWIGIGINTILDFGFTIYDLRIARHTPNLTSQILHPKSHTSFIIQLTATILFIALLAYSLGRPNWQQQYTAAVAPLDDWRQLLRGVQAQRFVESSLPYVKPNSIIWGDWEQYTPVRYYQFIHNLRTDVRVHNPLNAWPQKAAEAHAAGMPIYLARKPTNLIGTPYLSMVGPLIHLGTEPQFEAPTDITLLNANFENELELMGYTAKIWPQDTPGGDKAGSILQINFYWRVPQSVQWDYALSMRLVDANGQEIYKKDATHPVLSSYPTTLWTPGEVVSDFYELPMPPDTGPLTLHLIPYRTEGSGQWHNLTLTGTDPSQDGILLGPFEQNEQISKNYE